MTDKATAAERDVSMHADVIQRLLSIGGSMSNVMYNLGQTDDPHAVQFKELCKKWDAAAHDALDLRAAIKAQPAPTEAQGEDSARLDFIEKHAIKGATYKGITSANVILYEGEWHELGLRAAVDAARARASAEAGGVKS